MAFRSIGARLTRLSAFAERNPRTTAGSVAAFMGGCGDLAAQKIEAYSHQTEHEAKLLKGKLPAGAILEHKPLNFQRAMAMSTFCAFMGAVIYVPFFQALDKYIGAGRTLGIVLKKTAVNQLLLSPFVDLPIYFSWTGYLDGLTYDQAVARFKAQYMDTLYGTWAIWIPVGIFNFTFMPLHLRVPVAYTGEFFWSIAISYLAHRPIPEEEEAAVALEDAPIIQIIPRAPMIAACEPLSK